MTSTPMSRTLIVALGLVSLTTLVTLAEHSTVCYGSLGCFSSDAPFYSTIRFLSVTPSSPDSIRTEYTLYTRDNKLNGETLDARHPEWAKLRWRHFKARQTQFIVHGFVDDPSVNNWLNHMKDELLTQGDYNSIVVDWHHGNLPPYTQATANTRVVGAQIAALIQQLQTDFQMNASDFHIIGHSLGAHIAGYAGERVPGLGRITGLDPAGPYFEGTDTVVRLDPSDALFVDAVHTDDKNILQLGFGMKQAVGHADFYPNLGHDQPGCTRDPITNIINAGLVQGAEEVAACNHLRSFKFYTESINSRCGFKSFPCSSVDDFEKGRCHSCPKDGCNSMGFHATKPTQENHVKFFTTTADSAPFCQYHLDVKFRFSDKAEASSERGILKVRVHGDQGMSSWLTVTKDPVMVIPGYSYEYQVGVPVDFGRVQSVDFQWHHMSLLTNPLKWNPFNLRHPKLYLEEVDVTREESGDLVRFCEDAQGLETDDTMSAFTKC